MKTLSNLISVVRSKIDAHPLTALLIIVVWLLLEYIVFGPYSYLTYYDNTHYTSSQLALQHGGGLWLRYGLGGIDLLSTQFVVPISQFLNSVLPGFLAYQLQVLIALGGTALFTYLLLRNRLRLAPEASLIGAAAYALAYASPFSSHTLDYCLLPAVIWTLGWIASLNIKRAVAAIVGASFIYASFSLVVFAIPFIPIGAAVWFLLIEFRRDFRFWLLTALFWACYGLLKVPDVWSLLLNLPLSQRPLSSIQNPPVEDALFDTGMTVWGALGKGDHITLLTVFIIATVISLRLRTAQLNRVVLAIAMVALIMLIIMIVVRACPFFIERGLSTFTVARFYHVMLFFVAVASAFAVNAWLHRSHASPRITNSAVVATLLAILFSYSVAAKLANIPSWVFRGGYAAVYAKPALQNLADGLSAEAAPYRVGAYYLYSVPLQAYGMETIGGWYPFISARMRRYLTAMDNFRSQPRPMTEVAEIANPDFNISLLSLANVKYLVTFVPLPRQDLLSVLEPEENSWKLSTFGKLSLALRYNFGPTNKYYIHQNPSVLPRFFLTGNVRLFQSSDKLLKAMAAVSLSIPCGKMYSLYGLMGTRVDHQTMKVMREKLHL